MAEPTSALGFYDLLLRIAEKAGMAYYGSDGQGKAIAPVDAFNLDKVKRIVNDGFRRFGSSSPPRGWHWKERIASITLAAAESGTATSGSSTTLVDTTNRDEDDDYFNDWILTVTGGTGVGEYATITDFDNGTNTLTFSGGLSGGSTPDTTSSYRVEKVNLLPEDFNGQVDGPIEYAAATNNATHIEWVNESTIRHQRANFITTSYPQRAAVRPYQSVAGVLGTTRRWELLVDPAPVAANVLQFPYTSCFNQMDCETGIATGGSGTTLVDSTRAEADDYFLGWTLTIIAGVGLGQTATITGYDEGTTTFTFSAGLSGSSTPDTTSVYYIEPAANLHPAGFMFDQAVLQACLAETEVQVEEMNEGALELFYKVDLPLAHKTDGLSRPRKLRSKHQGRYPWLHQHRTWHNVTYG
jgi:hypothetical protein